MRKIFLLFLILVFVNSCGYTSLYKNNNTKEIKFNIQVVETAGNSDINNYIISYLNRYIEPGSDEKITIKLDTDFIKTGISNNAKGETTAYSLIVKAIFETNIKNQNKKIVLKEKIKINKFNDTFEQKNYEEKIKKNISNTIVDKFINRISILR